jgi:hypothetical protein
MRIAASADLRKPAQRAWSVATNFVGFGQCGLIRRATESAGTGKASGRSLRALDPHSLRSKLRSVGERFELSDFPRADLRGLALIEIGDVAYLERLHKDTRVNLGVDGAEHRLPHQVPTVLKP